MTAEFMIGHLWQSSSFALLAGLLAFVLRKSPPKVRYWVWLSASLKFLVPLALLVNLGTMLPRPAQRVVVVATPAPVPVLPSTLVQSTEPFTPMYYSSVPAPVPTNWTPVAIGILWALGVLVIASMRCRSWLQLQAALRAAVPIELPIPISAFIAPGANEPGIVGFLRPVLVLPPGLLERLNAQQLEAVLAHEMGHVRRHDNLFAAIHMAVEAIFWFHPLVWWLGSRMVEERERACDEEVLQMGCEPADYVEGILQVCRFYKESPLPCVSGVTGADVKKRLRTILTGNIAREWNTAKKAALIAAGIATIAIPIVIGILNAPANVVFAQATDARLKFTAADIHAVPPAPVGALPLVLRIVPVYADRYELDNATLPDMIGIAWSFAADKIVGGPTWLDMDRFDVRAKLPGDASPEDQQRMLQALLEDRFKLVVHKDTKPVQGYALTAGSKPALKRALGSEKSGCESSNTRGSSTLTYNCRNITMGAFVEGLRGMMGVNLFLGPGPVADATGLKGAWNFDLKWTQDYIHAFNGTTARVTIIDALDQQIGLKLEARPVPTPALVVDRVNRTPTPNSPDLARVMPPIPPLTRFDVASVKPTNPGSSQSTFHIQPGGRFVAEGIPMTGLFQLAFVGRTAENMPKWADSDRFDIVAKAPSGTVPLDRTTLGLPLQNLLKDRFKLTWHTEQRPAAAYILRAVKPKLKKADPASRTFCKRDMPRSGSQGGEWSMRLTCQNVTMAQFADWVINNGTGLVNTTVSDSTGLNGSWDFALIYSTYTAPPTPHPADAASPSGIASDPTAEYTIFEAMEKQLGLKLETTKGLRPVMVIDHIEQKPTGQ